MFYDYYLQYFKGNFLLTKQDTNLYFKTTYTPGLMFLNKTELPKHEIAETIFLTAEKHLANSKIAEPIFFKLSSAVLLWTNTIPAKFLPFACAFAFT